MHSLESLSKMTWGQLLRENCWTAQRRAKASAWRGEQGLCILVHTCITLPAWSLAIAARAVDVVDMAACTFSFIQSCGGGVQQVLMRGWSVCELLWDIRENSRVLSLILKLDGWMFGWFPLCREQFLRYQISSMTKAMAEVINHC